VHTEFVKLERLVDYIGRDRTADLDTHGASLEESFRRAIEAAERREAGPSDQENGVKGPLKKQKADNKVKVPAGARGGRVVASNINHALLASGSWELVECWR
jgi:hypothetical protein